MSAQTANGIDTATGVITVSIAGITAALTPEDAKNWAGVITTYAPLLVIGILIWRMRVLDKSLANCEIRHQYLEKQYSTINSKVLVSYVAALQGGSTKLPSAEDFDTGNFNVEEVLKGAGDD